MLKKYHLHLLPVFLLSFLILQEGGRNLGVLANLSLLADYYRDPHSLSYMSNHSASEISILLIAMGVSCVTGIFFGYGLVVYLNKRFKLAWIYGGIVIVGLMVQPLVFPGLFRRNKGMFALFGVAYLREPIYHIILGISLLCLGSWILFRWGTSKAQTHIEPSKSNRMFA